MGSLIRALAVAAVPTALAAQGAPPKLNLTQDLKIDLTAVGGQRFTTSAAVGPDGRIIVLPGYFGDIVAFDSLGKQLPWKIAQGRSDNADIGFGERVGWAGPTMWVNDPMFNQIALVDQKGSVFKSIEYPSWIHPHWAERRRYPLFASMQPLAVYADRSMLVMPRRPRSFISTPGFDKTRQYLMHVTADGGIERTVAQLPPQDEGRIHIGPERGGHTIPIPFFGKTWWAVSPDGMRVAVAMPDSASIRVVMLNERGDTAYVRRYPFAGARVTQQTVDSVLALRGAIGELSAEQVRSMIAKQIPAYRSRALGIFVGSDKSAWVLLRAVADTSRERSALILDAKGDMVGTVVLPPDLVTLLAVDVHHLWASQRGVNRQVSAIVRLTVEPTVAPRPRTASDAASSR